MKIEKSHEYLLKGHVILINDIYLLFIRFLHVSINRFLLCPRLIFTSFSKDILDIGLTSGFPFYQGLVEGWHRS